MVDLLEELRTSIADRYEILRELGRGGMATVYLARDRKHNREVAIKVLLPDLAIALGPERFKREIDLATQLSHPHILPLYDSGQANGHLYYVMTYVQGESLRARLDREKQLPLSEALRIAAEVASALEHAHRHGIIHRDIKPENILLEDGQALVADFGIARAISAVGEQKLTQTGVSLGTPAYMSPEQAMAERNLDGRCDIYSLGCVLYEMLAGSPPFTGPTAQAVIARHALDQVPSLSIVRGTIPEDVEDVVLTALAKVPADRFASAAEFADALRACAAQTATHRVTRGVRRPTLANRRRKGTNRRFIAAGVTVATLAAAGIAWGAIELFGPAVRPPTGALSPDKIAVLYFKDVDPRGGLQYLADGLTEALIGELTKVGGLGVISANGVAQFRGADAAPDSIGRALKAGTVVNGIVAREGNSVRVTLTPVDANTGDLFPPLTVVDGIDNALGLRTQIAEGASDLLREALGRRIARSESRAGTESREAWSLLWQAENARKQSEVLDLHRDTSSAGALLVRADSLLARAEAADGGWAEPRILRGRVAARMARRARQPSQVFRLIETGIAHVDAALTRDPGNADAHEVRALLQTEPVYREFVHTEREADSLVAAATKDAEAAIRTNPKQAGALNNLSWLLYKKYDMAGSHLRAREAYEADSYLRQTPEIIWRLFATSYDMEQFAQAERWCAEGKQRFPRHANFARCDLWMMTSKLSAPNIDSGWLRAAKLDSVAPAARREYLKSEAAIVVGSVIGLAGRAGSVPDRALLDSARRVLVRARTNREVDPTGELKGFEAFALTRIGDYDDAVKLLQRYLTEHPSHRRGFGQVTMWWWRDIQNDPRFKSLIAPGG